MKTTLITLICLMSLTGGMLQAQPIKFVSDGIIEYDKTINMFAVLGRTMDPKNGLDQQFYDQYKKNQAQFVVLKSTLSFAKDKAMFTPLEYTGVRNPYITYPTIAQNSTVYSDFVTRMNTTQKDVFGEQFLLKDSTKTIKWKITDETRDILGFPCRRANGVMMDSIYLVAFYTDDIPVSGGPESFNGLPGMILQLAMPHENISWMATKISEQVVPAIKPPAKGKPATSKEFRATIENAVKRYGIYAQIYLKGFLL